MNASQFGYLFAIGVSANPTYAQPLVVHNVSLGATVYCTVLLVATMDNHIYAFDGDVAPTAQHPYLWRSEQFDGAPAPFCVAVSGFRQTGILSTPVLDTVHQLLYFVTLTDKTVPAQCGNQAPPQNWVYTLHAISMKNGSGFGKDFFAPMVIQGTVPGTGDNATVTGCAEGVTSCVPFVPSEALQRPALLDVKGTIHVAFGFGTITARPNETPSYHGWMFGYKSCATGVTDCASPDTNPCFTNVNCGLQRVSIFNTTAEGHGGGIWMSGRGPAASAQGDIFFSVGNSCGIGQDPARCGADYGGNGYGESVVNLSTLDFFLPGSTESGFTIAQSMNYNDLDMGAGGVVVIPPSNPGVGSGFLVAGDKVGRGYLLKTSSLGRGTPKPYQMFLATTATATCPTNLPIYPTIPKEDGCAEIHSPAYWTRGRTGYLYVWGFTDILRAYPFSTDRKNYFDLSAELRPKNGVAAANGGILAISAESPTNATNAILWAITGNSSYNQGTLSAFQLWNGTAAVLHSLWSSNAAGTNYFTEQRFVQPIISNGKVYVTTSNTNATGQYSLWVYGLCSEGPGGVCGAQPGTPNN